jgi:hypothetical protein
VSRGRPIEPPCCKRKRRSRRTAIEALAEAQPRPDALPGSGRESRAPTRWPAPIRFGCVASSPIRFGSRSPNLGAAVGTPASRGQPETAGAKRSNACTASRMRRPWGRACWRPGACCGALQQAVLQFADRGQGGGEASGATGGGDGDCRQARTIVLSKERGVFTTRHRPGRSTDTTSVVLRRRPQIPHGQMGRFQFAPTPLVS